MTHLNLITFASELNKQGTIRHAHRQLFDLLETRYDVHIVSPDAIEALERNELQLVFISSGGVEYQFRNYYEQLPKPVVLLTDGLQNSLAASLEISTWTRRQGTACRIIHGNEETVLAELTEYEQLFAKRHLLAGKRIGVIGEPSKWLIASSVNHTEASRRWGIEFVDISLDEVESNFNAIGDGSFDDPLGQSTGAGLIFGTTGGVMEAALRTVADIINGVSSDSIDYMEVRGLEDGIKVAEVKIADLNIRAAVAHGLGNARRLMERVKAGEHFDFIEIMACPGGCINGGGQPFQVSDVRNWVDFKEKRAKALYKGDMEKFIRKSHNNPAIKKLYKEYLGMAGGMKAHKLLHTHYVNRKDD